MILHVLEQIEVPDIDEYILGVNPDDRDIQNNYKRQTITKNKKAGFSAKTTMNHQRAAVCRFIY